MTYVSSSFFTTLSAMNAARIGPRKPPTTGSYPGDVPKRGEVSEVSRVNNPNSGIASAKKNTLETRNCVGLSFFASCFKGAGRRSMAAETVRQCAAVQ